MRCFRLTLACLQLDMEYYLKHAEMSDLLPPPTLALHPPSLSPHRSHLRAPRLGTPHAAARLECRVPCAVSVGVSVVNFIPRFFLDMLFRKGAAP